MSLWQRVLCLALAGALGTLARYSLSLFVHRYTGANFPWATLAVNALGCFFAGLLWTLFEGRWPATAEMRVLILVGFMGAFTTFSAFILETGTLLRSAAWLPAAGNFLLQNGVGMAALFVGVSVGRCF